MDTTHSVVTNQSYELLKIILNFIGIIIWPLTVLVLIYLFKQEIQKLLERVKTVEFPGGFLLDTIEQDISEAKELSVEVKKERKDEAQKIINATTLFFETEANKRMVELGLTPSPSGLDLNYYRKIIDADPRLALIGLRADLEIMLKNLAVILKVSSSDKDSPTKIISKLFDKGAITSVQYQFITKLVKICNRAAHGTLITKEQAIEVLDIGEVLVRDYVACLYWDLKV